jgi:NADH-quinone oxidoreductase subunit B
MDAIIKLHEIISSTTLGPNREAVIKEVEKAALNARPTIQLGNFPLEETHAQ